MFMFNFISHNTQLYAKLGSLCHISNAEALATVLTLSMPSISETAPMYRIQHRNASVVFVACVTPDVARSKCFAGKSWRSFDNPLTERI